MKSTFESIMEDIIPEVNFLTVAGEGIQPGSVLESLDKDIEIGYLPDFLKDYPPLNGKTFNTIEEKWDLRAEEIEGSVSYGGAINFMKFVGLKYDSNKNYRLNFELNDITSIAYEENIGKINFEIALRKFRKNDRQSFRRFRGHFLVFRVLYASEYKVNVEVEKDGKFEADVNVKYVDVSAEVSFEKKESSILVSHNSSIPFGVIGFKIKANQLKEVD